LEIFLKLTEGAYYSKDLLCCYTSFGRQLESWAARMAPWAILNRRLQMKMRIHIAASLIAISLAAASVAFAQHGDMHGDLGKVEFPNSCNPAVTGEAPARHRHVALVLLFRGAAGLRGGGRGGPLLHNRCLGLRLHPDAETRSRASLLAENATVAQAAINKARKVGREDRARARLPRAVAAYYEDFINRPERARQLARAKAYESLAAKYPNDGRGSDLLRAVPTPARQTASDQTYSAYLKAAGADPRKQISRSIPTTRGSRTT